MYLLLKKIHSSRRSNSQMPVMLRVKPHDFSCVYEKNFQTSLSVHRSNTAFDSTPWIGGILGGKPAACLGNTPGEQGTSSPF